VHCSAAIHVQGKDTAVDFALADLELLQVASCRGLGAWGELDIATLGSPLVGQELTV